MAAYAALVSLMHLTDQIQHHPDPPVSLDQKQVMSLTKKVTFLQNFLQDFHSRGISREIQALESRIADAAHAAEDVIESHGVNHILIASGSTTERVIVNDTSADLSEGLQRVIQDMEFVEKEVKEIIKKSLRVEDDQLPRRSLLTPPPTGSSLTEKTKQLMVGFDEIMIQITGRLTGHQSKRDIVPIVGMGGSGKTTLARNVYEKQLIVEHFETRSWVTISQQFVVREVLIEILLCQNSQRSMEELSQESEEDLGERLYKSLYGRKYLIVMDDVWSIEAWEKLEFLFPDNKNGSRIMLTSRLSKLAFDLAGSPGFEMSLLDHDTSWELLCMKVFDNRSCPLELEEIGKTIAINCRGLPLSIVTIGGLLAKSDMTREYWKHVSENLTSLVNSDDDERCLRTLSLSYINLPVHIKPCFLYMGLFREDENIHASYLIKLWVAEGFLRPISGKSLEEVGEDCLKDLVERNLVFVSLWGFNGKIKDCVVHDLIRDLCLREAVKERFLHVLRIDNPQGDEINITQRRIAIRWNEEEGSPRHGTSYSAPLLRSCIIDSEKVLKSVSLRSVRLLRILATVEGYTYYLLDDIVLPVNARFLHFNSHFNTSFKDISFLYLTWNLQTLMIKGPMSSEDTAPLDIWNMSQLRHVKLEYDIYLSDPPPSSSVGGGRLLVLENLQTISKIRNFKCGEEVVRRIPNIKKLSICYDEYIVKSRTSMDYNLNNLGRLQKLESLAIELSPKKNWSDWLRGLTLPYELKKLTLRGSGLSWDGDMSTMIGSLEHLEVLKLGVGAFVGDEWNPDEGQFRSLKSLTINLCTDLKYWNVDNRHFPCLEHLQILGEHCLEEFPWGVGDIPTLRLIELADVRDSVVISAKQMLEEQEEEFGNVGLEIQVMIYRYQNALESLESKNFKMQRILSCTVM